MQLNFSFSMLLASISFVVLLSVHEAQTAPLRLLPGSVTLPLTPIPNQDGVHPQVLLQQTINRSLKRLARATGRSLPSNEELARHLNKRLVSLEGQGIPHFSKRYNRPNKLNDFSDEANAFVAGDDTGAGSSRNNPNITFSGNPTSANSLGLDIEGSDVGYIASVQMGTPPRDFLVIMDSGSADFWVGSETCVSEAGGGDCGNHKFLGPSSSSTFKDSGAPFQVSYGTGNVQGTIVKDDVNLAGLKLKGHTFGTANQESIDFSSSQTAFDGLMGLAKSTISQQQVPTPIEALAKKGLVNQAIVSYKIPRLADGKKDGEITFGAVDPTKFDANTLVTLPNVSKQGFWEADMPAVSVDGKDIGLKGRTAILDTGTTLLLAPTADATAIHAVIAGSKSDGQGGFTVPCDTKAKVALTFGKTLFEIDSRDLVTSPVDPANPNGDCISGIAAGNVGGDTEWLVGDVFLKNTYFSTNVDKNQIQLAKLV